MSTINDNINSIRNSLKDIRTVVNSKGAGIEEGDALNTWDEKIDNMPDVHVSGQNALNYSNLYYIRVVDKLTIPSHDENEAGYATTLSFRGEWQVLAKKIIIPRYYTSVSMTSYTQQDYYRGAEEVRIETEGPVYNINTMLANAALEKIDIPESTSVSNADFAGINATYQYGGFKKLTINMPKVTTLGLTSSSSTPTVAREVEYNANSVTTLSINSLSYTKPFYGCYGILNFPKVTTITNSVSNPIYGTVDATHIQKWILPALTSFTSSASSYYPWYSPNGGKVELWIGSDLATFTMSNSTVKSNFITAVTSGIIEFHIPSGDTTTKTTLNTFGIEDEYIHFDNA